MTIYVDLHHHLKWLEMFHCMDIYQFLLLISYCYILRLFLFCDCVSAVLHFYAEKPISIFFCVFFFFDIKLRKPFPSLRCINLIHIYKVPTRHQVFVLGTLDLSMNKTGEIPSSPGADSLCGEGVCVGKWEAGNIQ